jgi:hypothetical protein
LPEPKTFSVHYNALQAFIRQRKGSWTILHQVNSKKTY